MKFSELSPSDQVQYIKDGFVLILERLAKEPAKLTEYIPMMSKPVDTTPDFDKATEEYNKQTEIFAKVDALIKGLQKKAGCLCGSCLEVNINNSVIQPELEPLIDAAKKEAEAKSY
jgi:hypothetical protein